MVKDALIDSLSEEWRGCGVIEGDILLLHSSIRRTLLRFRRQDPEFGPEHILQSFLRALGPAGTLLLPTFNMDTTKGSAFNIAHSPSQMGILSETARNYPGVVRTGNPAYSFAVIGERAEEFRSIKNRSAWGADSPFAKLTQLDGNVSVLDVPDRHSMTYFHYVEEIEGVSYRYLKEFTVPYTDWDGHEEPYTFILLVRDLEKGVMPCLDEMAGVLWEKSLFTGERPGEGCGLRVVKARDAYRETAEVIRRGDAKGLLYITDFETGELHQRLWRERAEAIKQENQS